VNFQDLLNFKMKTVSNSTRNQLMEKVLKYSPTFQIVNSNQSIPMEQVGKTKNTYLKAKVNTASLKTDFDVNVYKITNDCLANAIGELSESDKILNYCKFHFEATAEAYRALYEVIIFQKVPSQRYP
jgi:hypothetical protein